MNRLITLVAAASASFAGTAWAAPFDIVSGLDGDEFPESFRVLALAHATPVVLNGLEADPLDLAERDELALRRAMPGVTAPLRTMRAPVVHSPSGRPAPLLGDLIEPVSAPEPVGGMDLVPTPGSLALLGVGGLGLAARRGD